MKKRALRVGLVGYNFMGKAHSNAWRQAGRFFDLPAEIEMRTLCGRSPAAVKSAAANLGWSRTSTDWREVVSDPEIDIVDICTPNDCHDEIAIGAAKHGKAVLCEKPLAMNVAECESMVAAVKTARVVNMVCHVYRRIPAIALASAWIKGPLVLGLGGVQRVLLALTVVISMLTVVPGRATRLQGELHLVVFAAYVFLAIYP